MNRIFKICLSATVVFLAAVYFIFLVVVPFIPLEKYKSEIQKIVHDNSMLNLDYSSLRLYSTPLLSVGIIAKDLSLSFDDETVLFSSSKIKTGIALPSLLTFTVKLAKTYIKEPCVNLDVVDSKQYKIVQIAEQIINKNNAKPKIQEEKQNGFINPEKIKIKAPSIKITNYLVMIEDKKTDHSLSLVGDKVMLGYIGPKDIVKIKADAKLLSDDTENIVAFIDISAPLPKTESEKDAIDPEEELKIPYINLIDIYQNYDFRANVNSKLKINKAKDGFVAHGYFNLDDASLKLGNIRLPDSYLHSKFIGRKIKYQTDINVKEDQKVSLTGLLRHSKHPYLKTYIASDDIHFKNMLELFEGLLDSLNIKNNLNRIEARGYLSANAFIETDFKKLKSKGAVSVAGASFLNPDYGFGINNVFANLIFDNNALDIKNTYAEINNSKLSIEGLIDSKSNVDIKINVDGLGLVPLYTAFAPNEIKKQYRLNSAKLTLDAKLKGKLDKLDADLSAVFGDLSLNDSKNIISIKSDKLSFGADNNNFAINPSNVIFNNSAGINIEGSIKNYIKKPDINILADANFPVDSIKKLLGKDLAPYFEAKGTIPAKLLIKGDAKKQNVTTQIYCDSQNYITPLHIKELKNHPSIVQVDVDIKSNKIKIKNSGLYKKSTSGFLSDFEQNLINSKQLVGIDSVIENNHVNLFRFKILENLNSNIALFKKSSFTTKGKLLLKGDLDDLSYTGDIQVLGLSIPEIFLKLDLLDLNFASKILNLSAKNLDLNSSKINAFAKVDLKSLKLIKISDINIGSDYIDVDKALIVSSELMKYLPVTNNVSSKNKSKTAMIPVFADGKFNIKKAKTGEIELFLLKGLLGVKNNDFLINNLSLKAFEGLISGDIKMNLITGLMTIKLNGSNINFDTMLAKAAGMKDVISGTLQFKTDISLRGVTYVEQIKSLKGTINFSAKNGQYGPFSKLENFFLAQNIRENTIFKNTIGLILSPLTTIDSSHYETLSGRLIFKNGFVYLTPITSRGNILCVLVEGKMDLLKNNIDSNVRVRLASAVSDMLGPLAMANPVNLVKNTPGLNIATAKLFTFFSQVVTPDEYARIPDFSSKHTDANATKFQIVLSGDVSKPLSLVKSFKWLALQDDVDKAKEFSDKYIKEQEALAREELVKKIQENYEQNNKIKVGVERALKMDVTAPEVKQIIVDEVLKSKKLSKIKDIKDSAQRLKTIKKESEQEENIPDSGNIEEVSI